MASKMKTVDWGGISLIVNDIKRATKPAQHSGAQGNSPVNLASVAGATKTLTEADDGGTFVFDRAAGCVVTLPTNAPIGWSHEFTFRTSITSNSGKVITGAATQFIFGVLISVDTDTTNALAYDQVGNGTTHVAITTNGSTTGGLLYTRFKIVRVSATLWVVEGINFGSGAVVTPFATS